jgi:hypothetical protein
VSIATSLRDTPRVLTAALGSLLLLAFAGTSFAQEPASRLQVKDAAGMFTSKPVIEQAKARIGP